MYKFKIPNIIHTEASSREVWFLLHSNMVTRFFLYDSTFESTLEIIKNMDAQETYRYLKAVCKSKVYIQLSKIDEFFEPIIKGEDMSETNVPSKDNRFTVITTKATTLIYTGGRKWFSSIEEAKNHAVQVFEQEKNSGKTFELAIVQVVEVVKPKPQIELESIIFD